MWFTTITTPETSWTGSWITPTASGDDSFLDRYRTGLAFYRDNLFLADGAPKWMSHRTHPFDIHGAAQALVTFSKAALELDPDWLAWARQVADWTLPRFQAPDGWFRYQQGRWIMKRYTLMRWCNAWMAFGLASLCLAEKKLAG